jgi:hypothetical protein
MPPVRAENFCGSFSLASEAHLESTKTRPLLTSKYSVPHAMTVRRMGVLVLVLSQRGVIRPGEGRKEAKRRESGPLEAPGYAIETSGLMSGSSGFEKDTQAVHEAGSEALKIVLPRAAENVP